MKQTMQLIHYGSTKFEQKKFIPIQNNDCWIKPIGGMWASPVNAKWGWRQWCVSEGYSTKALGVSFKFTYTGKIYTIDSIADAAILPWVTPPESYMLMSLDFEKLAKTYDAIYLTAKGEADTRHCTKHSLYGWDCECVLIMNHDGINSTSNKRAINY